MNDKITYPLRWPEDYPRTRIQDRKPQAAWKKNMADTILALEKELKRLKATDWLITCNDKDARDRDPGVAVYFSLKPVNQYGWQEALGFIGEIPTIAQIDRAYQQKAKACHPDGQTPDPELFRELNKHRDMARAWARGEERTEHEKVMPVDAFNEVRLNLNAVRLVIGALRQIERCGAPVMMERAFRGFAKALITQHSSTEGAHVTADAAR